MGAGDPGEKSGIAKSNALFFPKLSWQHCTLEEMTFRALFKSVKRCRCLEPIGTDSGGPSLLTWSELFRTPLNDSPPNNSLVAAM